MPDAAVLEPPTTAPAKKKPFRFTRENARELAAKGNAIRWAKTAIGTPDGQAVLRESQEVAGTRIKTGVLVLPLPREETALSLTGDKVRDKLARALDAQADALAPDEGEKLTRESLTGRDGTAQATKTLADAAATVFGWGDSTPGGLLVMQERMVDDPAPERTAQVTDVQTVGKESPARGQAITHITDASPSRASGEEGCTGAEAICHVTKTGDTPTASAPPATKPPETPQDPFDCGI